MSKTGDYRATIAKHLDIAALPDNLPWPPLTPEEKRNGWTGEDKATNLALSCPQDPSAYYRALLGDWRHAESYATAAVKRFKEQHDLGSPGEKRDLARLEKEQAHAAAQAELVLRVLESSPVCD